MIFDAVDDALIAAAVAKGGKVWDDETLAPVKRKIKNHYKGELERCCYCRKDFRDEFNMVIDIEHILPKSKFENLMFILSNLNISCKRCNMEIKRERIEFVTDQTLIGANHTDSALYRIVHPNLDVFEDHIDYIMLEISGKRFRKYIQKTEKGHYSYKFFELEKMEINTLNASQGIDAAKTELSDSISSTTKSEIIELISKF